MNQKPLLRDLIAQAVSQNAVDDEILLHARAISPSVYSFFGLAHTGAHTDVADTLLPLYLDTLKTPVIPTILR